MWSSLIAPDKCARRGRVDVPLVWHAECRETRCVWRNVSSSRRALCKHILRRIRWLVGGRVVCWWVSCKNLITATLTLGVKNQVDEQVEYESICLSHFERSATGTRSVEKSGSQTDNCVWNMLSVDLTTYFFCFATQGILKSVFLKYAILPHYR